MKSFTAEHQVFVHSGMGEGMQSNETKGAEVAVPLQTDRWQHVASNGTLVSLRIPTCVQFISAKIATL